MKRPPLMLSSAPVIGGDPLRGHLLGQRLRERGHGPGGAPLSSSSRGGGRRREDSRAVASRTGPGRRGQELARVGPPFTCVLAQPSNTLTIEAKSFGPSPRALLAL